MCRLLVVKSENMFDIDYHLKKFAKIAKNSKEYQGHGWGCSFLNGEVWQHYKNLTPIWEDSHKGFGRTKFLIAHARSAFEDKDIRLDNNMPFYDEDYVFIFNGELRGVNIRAEGRIGAEKIFNYVKKFHKGDMKKAIEKSTKIIKKRTEKLRAMNFIIADKEKVYLNTHYTEDEDYFAMRKKQDEDTLILCSQSYPGEKWEMIPNNKIEVW